MEIGPEVTEISKPGSLVPAAGMSWCTYLKSQMPCRLERSLRNSLWKHTRQNVFKRHRGTCLGVVRQALRPSASCRRSCQRPAVGAGVPRLTQVQVWCCSVQSSEHHLPFHAASTHWPACMARTVIPLGTGAMEPEPLAYFYSYRLIMTLKSYSNFLYFSFFHLQNGTSTHTS